MIGFFFLKDRNRADLHHRRLCAELSRVPEHQVCEFSNFNYTPPSSAKRYPQRRARKIKKKKKIKKKEAGEFTSANDMAHSLSNGRINRILRNIPLHPKVVGIRANVLFQRSKLGLVLTRRLPRPEDDLSTPPHGLAVTGHHRYRAHVVQDVFCGDGLFADAGLCERDVFGDGLGQVVADHEHVQVLRDCVFRQWPSRVRGGGEHVEVLDDRDDVGRVPAAGALGVVGVDRTPLECCDGLLDEAGLVESVRVDEALHVVLVAYAQAGVDCRGRRAPVFVQLEADYAS